MSSETRVLLLTVDTLRKDRFTDNCFPESMGILRDQFALFDNAYSQGNATPLAFPGIISGHSVVGDGAFPSGASTIAETVSGPSIGFSNNAHLREERGYARGFDAFADLRPPDVSPSIKQRAQSISWIADSDLVVKVYDMVKRLSAAAHNKSAVLNKPSALADVVTDYVLRQVDSGNRFVWGHYMDPHKPFIPSIAINGPTIDRTNKEIKELNSYDHEDDPLGTDDMQFIEELYESNIRYFDLELARLLRELESREWYEDALVVLVGDHGELFGEHGYMWHPMNTDPFEELIQIPMAVKYPRGKHAGEVFDHLVQHADILPTIAAATGDTSSSPKGVHPLNDESDRYVVSKSNTAIKLTEKDAVAIRRRNDIDEGIDEISTVGREILEAAEFPEVQTSAGIVKGVDDVQRRDHLEALGYVE